MTPQAVEFLNGAQDVLVFITCFVVLWKHLKRQPPIDEQLAKIVHEMRSEMEKRDSVFTSAIREHRADVNTRFENLGIERANTLRELFSSINRIDRGQAEMRGELHSLLER